MAKYKTWFTYRALFHPGGDSAGVREWIWASMMEFNELHVINLINILLIGIVLGFPDSPLRVVLGLPFLLFFPGYTLIAALCPRREDLSNVERLALSLGISVAIVALIGLILNSLPWGLRLGPVLFSLISIIVICSLFAAQARRRLSRAERLSIEIVPFLAKANRLSWSQITIAAIITTSIVFFGWRMQWASSHPRQTFTEFYVLGPSGKADDYPNWVTPGGAAEVIVGIINHELKRTSYKITVRVDSQILRTLGPMILENGQKWEQEETFRPVKPNRHERVEFLLFKNNDATPYRRLHLWIEVSFP